MDALKILTRSLGPSKISRKATNVHCAPSQGAASNPQLFGSANGDEGLSTGCKKCKRQGNEPAPSEELPKELDFFGDQNGAPEKVQTSSEKPVKSTRKQKNMPGGEVDLAGSTKEEDPETLEPEESRRILKQHKIKITELWTPAASVMEDISQANAKKRKRAKTAAPVGEPSKKKKRRLDVVPQPLTSFVQLRARYNMSERLLGNLAAQGYSIPTEVQLGSLPLLCDAQHGIVAGTATHKSDTATCGPNIDLLTVAPTGSGKTLAFLIPVLNAIMQQQRAQRAEGDEASKDSRYNGVQAIIVAPTKELASQIVNEARKLTLNTGVKVTLVRKGMKVARPATPGEQEAKNEDIPSAKEDEVADDEQDEDDTSKKPTKTTNQPPAKAQVLVSTPLTLVHAADVADLTSTTLSSVRYLILDEADVLLDPLFRSQTLQIWNACTNPTLRVSLWSATMGSSIESLALSTLESRQRTTNPTSPQRAPLLRLVVGLKDSAIPNVAHHLLYAGNEQGKLLALRQLLRPSTTSTTTTSTASITPPFLVFTQTIPRAVALHSELRYDIPQEAGGSSRIAVLHADLSDTAREKVMAAVRKGEVWVLITTDLLSRGVDFRGVNGVVNYDFPGSSAVYVHRVGRTGRAGREGGVAVTLYVKEDIPFVKNVVSVIAAAEGLRGGGEGIGKEGLGARRRLLESLPKPSKREKQRLKKRGVESRRPEKESAGTRISTKSGYQRRLENNRKGVGRGGGIGSGSGSGSTRAVKPVVTADDGDGDDFSGFDD